MRAINRIVLHHSASSRLTTARDISRWHKGKPPYHFVIQGDGKLVVSKRRLPTAGAHAKGANFDSIGICIVGDNRKPGRYEDREVRATDLWVRPQIDGARALIAAAKTLMPWLTLHGHRHVGTTKTFCPGDFTLKRLRELFL
jgi:hypothetical protein